MDLTLLMPHFVVTIKTVNYIGIFYFNRFELVQLKMTEVSVETCYKLKSVVVSLKFFTCMLLSRSFCINSVILI